MYLADGGRCDMLPALLSENVCSLLGGCERLAVSCVWTLDARFRPVNRTKGGRKPDENPWFGQTVIRSDHQLNYYQAQAILDGKPPPTEADDLRDDRETRRVRADLAVLAAFAARRNALRCVYFFYFRIGDSYDIHRVLFTGASAAPWNWRPRSFASRRRATEFLGTC